LFMDYAPELGVAEVPDPYLGDAEDFNLVLDLVEAAARGLIAELQQGRTGDARADHILPRR